MRCPTAHMLSRYEDALIEETERGQIRQHVVTCMSCQQVVARYRAETRFIEQTLRTPQLPASFEEELRRQLKPRAKSPLFLVVVIAAVTGVLFVLTFFTAEIVR